MIAVAVALILLALVIIGAVSGSDHRPPGPRQRTTFSDSITTPEYNRLHPGLTAQDVADQLGETGTSEASVPPRLAALFPSPRRDIDCILYVFSDRPRTVARLCYGALGPLRQKLLRQAPPGVVPGQ